MPTRFIRRKEVCHLTGLSPSSVYLLMNQNKFPASIRLPGGAGCCLLTFGRSGNGNGSASLRPVNRPTTPKRGNTSWNILKFLENTREAAYCLLFSIGAFKGYAADLLTLAGLYCCQFFRPVILPVGGDGMNATTDFGNLRALYQPRIPERLAQTVCRPGRLLPVCQSWAVRMGKAGPPVVVLSMKILMPVLP